MILYERFKKLWDRPANKIITSKRVKEADAKLAHAVEELTKALRERKTKNEAT